MAAVNRFEQNAANCVRLAVETKDFVLSAGYIKMAEAWADLAARRNQGTVAARSSQAPNRRSPRHKKRKSAKAGTKFAKAA
jgi:hypothetical protein